MTTQKILESVQRADNENTDPLRESFAKNGDEVGTELQRELTDEDYELVETFLENI